MTILICEFLIAIISFIVGFYIGRINSNKKQAGIFHVNTTNPDKDIIQIELMIPIGELVNEKEIIFEVKDESQ